MYLSERLSTNEIAKELGFARSAVLKYLKVHGIPVRISPVRWAAGRGLPYGKRILNRQEATHKCEVVNILKMKELREKGFSYWRIADAFKTLEVPTKTGKGRWHARSIQQILDAYINAMIGD